MEMQEYKTHRRLLAESRLEDRFWSKVARSGDNDCWEWSAARYKKGYGFFRRRSHQAGRKGDCIQAHRMAWELTHGAIPEGRMVCHHCDNPPCCNPRHLFLGDNEKNMRDMAEKGRSHKPRGGKLKRVQVDAMRSFYDSGKWSQQEIANHFGINQTRVSQIIRRRDWMPRE